jgi:hypothetical protein
MSFFITNICNANYIKMFCRVFIYPKCMLLYQHHDLVNHLQLHTYLFVYLPLIVMKGLILLSFFIYMKRMLPYLV